MRMSAQAHTWQSCEFRRKARQNLRELRRRGLLFYWDANVLAFSEGGKAGSRGGGWQGAGGGKEKNPKGKSHFHSSYLLRSPLPCGRDALRMLEI